MFENIFGQSVTEILKSDVQGGRLPTAILFSGPKNSGKFSAALELARVLSCEKNGLGDCGCKSCAAHKILASPNLIAAGGRGSLNEIKAAAEAFSRISAKENSSANVEKFSLLFVRALQKLLLRFNPIAWEGSPKSSSINKNLEKLSELTEAFESASKENAENAVKKIDAILKNAAELEDFLTDVIPISQIRKIRDWSMQTSSAKRKTVIFENADFMNDSGRNALLKVLEEANSNSVFVLLTENKSRIMPTILSRVRNYAFSPRSREDESRVAEDQFAANLADGQSLSDYFMQFSPIPVDAIKSAAEALVDFAFRGGGRPSEKFLASSLGKEDKKSAAGRLFKEILVSCSRLDFQNLSEGQKSLFFSISKILSDANEQMTMFGCTCDAVLEEILEKIGAGSDGLPSSFAKI